MARASSSYSMYPHSYGGFAYPTGNWTSSSRQFNNGDRVILNGATIIRYRPTPTNPIWGASGLYIVGTVLDSAYNGSDVLVVWDNGEKNTYSESDLEIYSDSKKPKTSKSTGKKIELDTTKLEPLVIKPDVKHEIVALLQQHKFAEKIFKEWGLEETIEYGKGMTLLFYGTPGTGKTFGANCIAKALGKELLIISAAEIQSSEPGGANRNIQNAFTEAKEKDKVLFLDECDSLIANRANLGMILSSEINTLLTEIEKFEGVCILATNRVSDMDTALERRIQLIIEFQMPTEEQRKEIWKKIIPKKMPLAKDVTIDDLAKHVFSGGIIKNIVLASARLAVSEESKEVKVDHFTRAIDRVKKSQGIMGKQRIQHDGMDMGTGTQKVKTMDVTNLDKVFGSNDTKL